MFAVASRTFDVVHVDGRARKQILPRVGFDQEEKPSVS